MVNICHTLYWSHAVVVQVLTPKKPWLWAVKLFSNVHAAMFAIKNIPIHFIVIWYLWDCPFVQQNFFSYVNRVCLTRCSFGQAKLAKLRRELLTPTSKGGGGAGEGFDVTKSGDARVGLVGFPSVGKSTLLNKLTGTFSEVCCTSAFCLCLSY